METRTCLEEALKNAIRAGDDRQKTTIRMALAAIRQADIDKGTRQDENAVLALLQKEIKSRQESIDDARRANRPDLEDEAQSEIEILQKFLPEPLSAEELDELAKQAIAEVGATNIREMGLVMKILVPRLSGRATGDHASQTVRKLLQ